MAQIDYTDMVPEIQFHIPACPTPLALRAIREATRVFCDESEAYQVDLSPITLLEGVNGYALPGLLPAYTVLSRIISVKYDGYRLTPTSRALLDQSGKWQDVYGTPSEFFKDTFDTLRIYPKPFGGSLDVRVALKPARTSTGLDETILDTFWDGIVAGSLARLFTYKNTGWEDAGSAQMYAAAFTQEISEAAKRARNDDQPKRKTVAYGGY